MNSQKIPYPPKWARPQSEHESGNGRTVAAIDVLAPGIGEIIGGSQREERLKALDRNIAERGIDKEHYAPTLPFPRKQAGEGARY